MTARVMDHSDSEVCKKEEKASFLAKLQPGTTPPYRNACVPQHSGDLISCHYKRLTERWREWRDKKMPEG